MMADPMLAPGSVAELVGQLRRYHLVSSARLDELIADSYPDTPQTFAQLLLERGLLTHFQVNLLFQGRAAELLLEPYLVLGASARAAPGWSSRPATCACGESLPSS